MIVSIVLAVILLIAVVGEFYTLKTGVPTVASFPSARRKIIEILKKEADSYPDGHKFTVIDLGSGAGQLCTKIASALPQARVIGIELSFVPWLRSVIYQRLLGIKNLEFQRIDFWSYDCSKIDVVVMFLTSNILERLSYKLRNELKAGAFIVANDEALQGDWHPIDIQSTGFLNLKVYVYRQT